MLKEAFYWKDGLSSVLLQIKVIGDHFTAAQQDFLVKLDVESEVQEVSMRH